MSKQENPNLGDHIARLAAELTVGEHALVTAIGTFEDSGQWAREGAISCAHWLSWRIGMSPEASRERVRVAKALRGLPNIDEAFRTARLSYSKVRAVTRVATPANEALLIQVARASTAAQLESICRKFRGCLSPDPAEPEARRRMSVRTTDRGTMRVSLELPADEGARLLAAVESGRAALSGAPDHDSETTPTTRVDGLMAVVESWFADGPKPRRGGAPHEVILHVSAETLCAGSEGVHPASEGAEAQPGAEAITHVPAETHSAGSYGHRLASGRVEAQSSSEAITHVPAETRPGDVASQSDERTPLIDAAGAAHVPEDTRAGAAALSAARPTAFIDAAEGVGVSAETARRLCCDASVSALLEDSDGNVLDVGRKRRTVPAGLARALEAREGRGCSFPGCTHKMFVDKHHLRHWADGGPTSLENLCQLCRHHHTFVHEHGWRVERTAEGLKFITPRGRVIPAAPEAPPVAEGSVQALAANAALELDDVSLQTEGWGDPVDYVHVIDALLRETFVNRSATQAASRSELPTAE